MTDQNQQGQKGGQSRTDQDHKNKDQSDEQKSNTQNRFAQDETTTEEDMGMDA